MGIHHDMFSHMWALLLLKAVNSTLHCVRLRGTLNGTFSPFLFSLEGHPYRTSSSAHYSGKSQGTALDLLHLKVTLSCFLICGRNTKLCALLHFLPLKGHQWGHFPYCHIEILYRELCNNLLITKTTITEIWNVCSIVKAPSRQFDLFLTSRGSIDYVFGGTGHWFAPLLPPVHQELGTNTTHRILKLTNCQNGGYIGHCTTTKIWAHVMWLLPVAP